MVTLYLDFVKSHVSVGHYVGSARESESEVQHDTLQRAGCKLEKQRKNACPKFQLVGPKVLINPRSARQGNVGKSFVSIP